MRRVVIIGPVSLPPNRPMNGEIGLRQMWSPDRKESGNKCSRQGFEPATFGSGGTPAERKSLRKRALRFPYFTQIRTFFKGLVRVWYGAWGSRAVFGRRFSPRGIILQLQRGPREDSVLHAARGVSTSA